MHILAMGALFCGTSSDRESLIEPYKASFTMLTVLPRSVQRLKKYQPGVFDSPDPAKSVRNERDPDPPPLSVRDNQLLFAFWTCLQLERCVLTQTPCVHALQAHPWPRLACSLYELINF